MRVVSFGGQDLISQALEAIERSWKVNRFGGYRVSDKYLQGPVYVFIGLHLKVIEDELNTYGSSLLAEYFEDLHNAIRV